MGADIPFFFTSGTALCTGRGDLIEPILSKAPYVFMLIYPGFPSLTGPVYQNLKLGLTKGKKNINVFLDILRTHVVKGIHEVSFNRLQHAAFETTPKLEVVWRTLKDRGYGEFHLTGSGSSFFRMIDPEERDLPSAGEIEAGTSWRAFEARSLRPP
jgi:4-diphosphocytidyl-2-C-methyl-D-erythritol kinase